MNRTISSSSRGKLLQAGIILFLIGVIGFLYWYSQTRIFRLDRFLSDQVVSFTEFKAFDKVKETDYPGFYDLINDHLTQGLRGDEALDVEAWGAGKMAMAQFPNQQKLWAFHGVDLVKVRKWMDTFLVEGEKFEAIEYNQGRVFVPSFSSELAFGLSGRWFLIATDSEVLKSQFRSSSKLAHLPLYKDVFSDLPSKALVKGFFNTQALIHDLSEDPRWMTKKPVMQALGDSFKALGLSGVMKDGHLTFYTKMMVHDGIFHKDYLKTKSKDLVPELAAFVPQDGLYFMTGYDIYEKFQHSKTFLSSLHPQFSVIFEGVLRAKSHTLFGPDFDFDKDLLSHMHGQYGVWVDKADEGLGYVFLTGFGGADKEQSLEHLLEALSYAQSRFVSEVQVVELPDGTSREELVSVRPGDLPIRKVETDFGAYYTFEGSEAGADFSFGFFNGVLVFSTDYTSLERVVSVLSGGTTSLSENDDFRDSVLFRYGPSESYGFINAAEIDALEVMLEGSAISSPLWNMFKVFRQDVRNISFARRVYREEIFMTFTFFGRSK